MFFQGPSNEKMIGDRSVVFQIIVVKTLIFIIGMARVD